MAPNTPDRKRARNPTCAWALAACSLLTAVALPALAAGGREAATTPSSSDIRKKEQELQQVKGKIDSLRSQIQRERGQKDQLGDALEAAEKKLGDAQARLRGLRREIAAQNERIKTNQVQQAEAQYRLDEQRQVLARQVRAAYVMGNRARTQLWLNQDDTARIGRVLAEYDYVNRARAGQVAAVQAELDRIAELQAQLIDERARLESLELEQTQALNSLEKSRLERQSTLAQIEKSIASSEGELKQAQADEAQVRKLLETLRDALADIPGDFDGSNKPFLQQRGKLPWPLRGPVIAEYGSPKAEGRLSWSGRWIAAREGTPVRAIARGRVAYVGWLQRYGLIVILEHGGGYFTLYGHCATSSPTAGEWVDAGQVIATAGDTGGHDRSGVYLELRKGSTALDPREWLGK
ncbi:MAG: Septal ring factor EnvC, activator of murein hydrolase AmiA and AmiB [Hydrocarboniphaga sp.]|uniref:murein hydrolase activator EnvC family protein n=1 Tax=Hydrocarboniphaga sp. TaxID=2033016 RepID=UPI002634CE4D|nr:peptidoglycan DD-metalloendopeptidase family protein [Hydrocarboniphaga sp.]MDB5972052.1 Septal ring factor EnvC, activator of murein hydrolase AmiA and AmiB [Hydrocarboniphaga sp.]